MRLEGEQTLLRVYLRNTDRHGWGPLAQFLLRRAMDLKLEGATLFQARCGLDVTGRMLEPRWWSLLRRVPVVLEVFDRPRAVGTILAVLADHVSEGLASLERAHVLAHRRKPVRADMPAGRPEVPGQPTPWAYLPDPEEFPIMRQSIDGQLLRVFIDASDRVEGERVYRVILRKAKELGLSWVGVFRPDKGFGVHNRLHSATGEYETDTPIVVEVIDAAAKVQEILPFLDQVVEEGLITTEGVRLLRYGPWPTGAAP
jgi:PII-like signaling protein